MHQFTRSISNQNQFPQNSVAASFFFSSFTTHSSASFLKSQKLKSLLKDVSHVLELICGLFKCCYRRSLCIKAILGFRIFLRSYCILIFMFCYFCIWKFYTWVHCFNIKSTHPSSILSNAFRVPAILLFWFIILSFIYYCYLYMHTYVYICILILVHRIWIYVCGAAYVYIEYTYICILYMYIWVCRIYILCIHVFYVYSTYRWILSLYIQIIDKKINDRYPD